MTLLVIGICGCTHQVNNTEQTLMNDIKETMPTRVYEELSEVNMYTNNDNTISVKNNNDNPTHIWILLMKMINLFNIFLKNMAL